MSANFCLLPMVALLGALAGCQSTGETTNPDEAYRLSARLADVIGRCWFADGADTAFAEYQYSPERNADQSRVLIVRKSDPTGLPVLVVEATGGRTVDLYGPLLDTSEGPRIRADVERWVAGGTACR